MAMGLFLDRRSRIADDLVSLFQGGDWETLRDLCEEIRDTASIFGFTDLARRAEETIACLDADVELQATARSVLRLVAGFGTLRTREVR